MYKLKELRLATGYTQAELSECSGVNIRMIQKYENGDKDLNQAQGITLYMLACALECNMEDLIDKSVADV